MADTYRMLSHKLLWHPDVLAKWRRGEPFFPVHLDIGATSRCNYRCVHCFYDYLGHRRRDLDREVLLRLMRDIAEHGVRSIFFASQGEPLLNPATPEAIVTADRHGVDVAMSSNGSLFTPEVAREILPHLKWVRISVLARSEEAYCALHGASSRSWRAVFDNLAAMSETVRRQGLGTVLGVQTCLLRENGDEIVPLVRHVKELGFHYITLRPISQLPANGYRLEDDLLRRFQEQLQEAESLAGEGFDVVVRWNLHGGGKKEYDACLGLPFIAFVNADGGVYTCGCRLDEEPFCYGNLYDEPFPDLWMSEKRKQLTERASSQPDFARCDLFCRHHAINQFLWEYAQEPPHVNFI
ncbi:MAG TPA: radical SAM protein [Desulfobacterales bacterium]|nr:radical SAM protein [Desulfobacterales bacterium]